MTSSQQTARAEKYMRLALQQARKARQRTWPNPMVGALVVRRGRIVGRGYHHRAGMPHAEIEALKDAGDKARGADIYVTLEPCHHFGRTPPCTEALAQAGIKRVFIGACDPNPRECGAGIARLEDLGMEARQGILEQECEDLNRAYNVFIQHGRPLVTVKAACSLDGRLAPVGGDARWISGKVSRTHAHRLRARNQGILVGAGTVRQDNPSLNVRHVAGRDPAVVVLDGKLSLPLKSRLLSLERKAPVYIYTSRRAPAVRARRLEKLGAQVIRAPSARGLLDLEKVLADLLERGVYTLLVEGGSAVIGSLLKGRLVDWVELAMAPVLLGSDGIPLARFAGARRVAQAVRIKPMKHTRRGDDVHLSGPLVWPEGG